jgi:hypothetical protein
VQDKLQRVVTTDKIIVENQPAGCELPNFAVTILDSTEIKAF